MRRVRDPINIGLIITSISAGVICTAGSSYFPEGYEGLVIFPYIFLLIYMILLEPIRKSQFAVTSYGVIIMQWLRFVLLPVVIMIAKDGEGFSYINPSKDAYSLALLLCIYEFILTSLIINFVARKWVNKPTHVTDITVAGSSIVYMVYVVIVILIAIIAWNQIDFLHFIVIPISKGFRLGDAKSTISVLIQQLIIVAQYFLLLIVIDKLHKRYEKTGNPKLILWSIIYACLNLAVIIGERRTVQIYLGLICIMVLSKYYAYYKSRIVTLIAFSSIVVITGMSVYKFLYAFQYDSYYAALSNSSLDISWFSRYLQAYFFGLENVAATIDFGQLSNLSLNGMLYDIFRSIFGISFLFKGRGLLTSELFNTYLYGTPTQTGHVISSVGYGFIYLGQFLAPIISTFNILISIIAERNMKRSKSVEGYFLFGMILLRFSTNLFVNSAPLINYSTLLIFSFGLVFAIAKIFSGKLR